jgi:ABC-2 type transport system permease protein
VVEQPSAETAAFTSLFRHSRYFVSREALGMREAERALRRHDVDGIVHLRADFGRRLDAGREASIQLILNGVDANTARVVQGYVQGVWATWLSRRATETGANPGPPVRTEQRIWYNAQLASRNYLVPGLIAVIMTLIGALLTALVMAREWERGTMEALMVTPVSMGEVLIGKLVPYFVLGMGSMALSVGVARWLFEVPLRGSPFVLLAASALFLAAALGMGLAISITARNQFVAGLAAIITTFLPAFILSGFVFDIDSMPWPVQVLTHVVAARYFVALLQTLFLAGDVWAVILPNAAALVVLAALFLSIVRRRAVKRLE